MPVASNEEVLTLDKLACGDRPAVTMTGLIAARVLKEHRIVVFMVDVLGRIQVMPADSVKVVKGPRVDDEDLDLLLEDDAIHIMLAQGDDESAILGYMHRRKERGIDADAGLRQDAVLSDDTAASSAEVREES
jgi:hypothetical protein